MKICYVSDNLLLRLESLVAQDAVSDVRYLLTLVSVNLNELYIASCITCCEADDTDAVLSHIPGGFEVCGMCIQVDEPSSLSEVENACCNLPVTVENTFGSGAYFIIAIGKSNSEETHLYSRHQDTMLKIDYTIFEEDSLHSWIKCRLQASIPISFEHSSSQDQMTTNIKSQMKQVQSVIHRSTTAFHVLHSNCILYKDNFTCCTLPEDTPCAQLFTVIDSDHIETNQKRRKAGDLSQDVVYFSLLNETTGDGAAENSIKCAPVIHHEHRDYKLINVALPVDVVVYMHAADHIVDLPARLLSTLDRQLNTMCHCLLQYSQDGEVRTPEAFHFQPLHYDHIVSVVYPRGVDDQQLESERRTLHQRLQLACDRPCVRRLNAYQWPDDTPADGRLLNVHHGLQASARVQGGKCYLVSGRYAYHHYMQDRFNDDKWGCAYRSLQTLVSWFRLQGYTDKPVPTHKQIQQILVDINDKPASIIGSKSWIGSTEVSYVLDTYIGVTSKILFVNSGADMATKGRELAMHFESQGTPIMIGGGVLAHTILGVDFNDVTGDLHFLILDPHYTGAEDLKTIQDKGWCGWKGVDFWDKNAHYNMCMPQRPDVM